MANISKKNKLITTKIGQRFETFYYFKQKVVNWEYIAPEGYQTPLFIDVPETYYSDSYKDIQKINNVPCTTTVTKYVTEASFKNKIYYIVIESTNTAPTLWDITIHRYTNLDTTTITTPVDISLNNSSPSAISSTALPFQDSGEVIYKYERWKAESNQYCKLGPKYNATIYSINAPYVGFKQDVSVHQQNTVYANNSKTIEHILHVSKIQVSGSEQIQNTADATYLNLYSKDILAVVHNNLCPYGIHIENLNHVFSNTDLTYYFKKAISFIGAV